MIYDDIIYRQILIGDNIQNNGNHIRWYSLSYTREHNTVTIACTANDTLVKLSVLKLYHVIKDPWNNSINEQSKPISIKTQTYTENKIEL
jgi:hypothetical protein